MPFVIVRIILGAVFASLGFWLADRYLAVGQVSPQLTATLVSFAAGSAAVFALPLLVEKARDWFINLVQSTVAKTVSQSTGKFLAAQTARFKEMTTKPKKEKGAKEPPAGFKGAVSVLDTSAIIDGRILDIVRTGFLFGVLVVPQFILDELQRVADSSDDLKRQRGRRGLEILDELKKEKGIKLEVHPAEDNGKGVDHQLLALAKRLKARLVTVDFNLNKVASIADIKILNINELANAIKTIVLPGEKLAIKVVQEGKEEGQGVGYLKDGTMVVIEDGGDLIGREVSVEVSRILQTAAGRMVFTSKS